MERHTSNALRVARFLLERPQIKWVNYPGIENHSSHPVARKQFEEKGFGGMLTFGFRDAKMCFRFINHLKLIHNLANLGDCKTLIIHPYSTQYVSFDESTRKQLSITPDLIRLSVGIEAVEDICDDIGQALDSL
jgi:O-acetylhomoserine (thiol)-lyase